MAKQKEKHQTEKRKNKQKKNGNKQRRDRTNEKIIQIKNTRRKQKEQK